MQNITGEAAFFLILKKKKKKIQNRKMITDILVLLF